MSTATVTFSDPDDSGRVKITIDFDPPLSSVSDQPAPYTHVMAAMALQYAREKFAEGRWMNDP